MLFINNWKIIPLKSKGDIYYDDISVLIFHQCLNFD